MKLIASSHACTAAFLVFVSMFFAARPAFAQVPCAEQTYQLLTPEIGWMQSQNCHLEWTSDGGAHWKDITPPDLRDRIQISPTEMIVYFLNDTTGWVLFNSRRVAPDPRSGTEEYALAQTIDAGQTWSISYVVLMSPFAMAFADAHNGWMLTQLWVPLPSSNPAINRSGGYRVSAKLLATSDGGRTWKDAPAPIPGTLNPQFSPRGRILAVSAKECWLVTGEHYEGLFVTRDGGQTWSQVSLTPPANVHANGSMYDLPIFGDARHGFEAVTFCDPWRPAAVLFETDDGGTTWKADRTLLDLKLDLNRDDVLCRVASTVSGNTWIIAMPPHDGSPAIADAGSGQQLHVGSTLPSTDFESRFPVSPLRLSFVSPTRGWMWSGGLRSTSDGGKTWTLIDPDPAYAGEDSLHGLASVLDSATTKEGGDLKPFSYKVRFDQRTLRANTAIPSAFIIQGFYAFSDTGTDYRVAVLRLYQTRRHLDPVRTRQFRPPDPCTGAATSARAEGSYSEPTADHAPVGRWSIDFPQIESAIAKNADLFHYGADTIEITTAHHLEIEEREPREGTPRNVCATLIYNGDPNFHRLNGIDGPRVVAEVESIYPSPGRSGCRQSQYLTLDAVSGANLERGTYERCEQYPR